MRVVQDAFRFCSALCKSQLTCRFIQSSAWSTRARTRALPLLLTGLPARERREHVDMALNMVGLADRVEHYPSELSGGQQQRVAIARAIITDPAILVADEPTGDLDRVSAEDILALMDRLNSELGKTIIMVTHDPYAAKRARTVKHLEKGVLVD